MEGERSDLIIRTLTLDDCARLVRMDEEHSGRSRSAWFQAKIQHSLRDSDVRISLGTEKDGLLVGALLGSMNFGEFGSPEPVAILDTVLVDHEFSRQGIASAMFDQLLKNLRGLRISALRTEVAWNELDLIAFFEKVGFVPAPRLVLELDLGVDD